MAIYANTIIKDALSLVDVTAPGEDPEAYWTELSVRLLNGLLSEWALKGIYNPNNLVAEFYPTTTKDYFTLGTDDSITLSSPVKYSITATVDTNGKYYKSVNGNITKYSTVGSGSTYSLVVTEDTAGTFYQIAGGYTQLLVGDIPNNFANIVDIQVDLGTVVYNPKRISVSEYMSISIKQTQSVPQVYAWDYQQPISKIYFWPKLLTNLKIRVIGQPTIEQVASNMSNIPIDRMYYNAILYNLAASLYPFLKSDKGIDQEIIYKAKSAVMGLKSRVLAMTSKRVNCPFGGDAVPATDYWISPLNTVGGSN